MTTISVQLLNDDALGLLRELERLRLIKFVRPLPEKSTAPRLKKNVPLAEAPAGQPQPEFKAGFGGAKGMIHLAPDWDEPLEELNEYMY